MRALLIGNYGVANFGDEALRDYFLKAFPELEWTVLTAGPLPEGAIRFLPRLPLGVRSVFRPWWRTITAFWRTDVVIFGGGTLFTDIESVLACLLWGKHAVLARLFGKPVIFAFQGVGPFKSRLGEGIARLVFGQAVFVSVRDDASYKRLVSWNLSTNIVHTFDPVFLSFTREKIDARIQKMFIVIPRHNTTAMFEEVYKKALSEHDFDGVRILSLQPHDLGEQAVVRRLTAMTSLPVIVVPISTQSELLVGIAQGSLVLSQRFHGALAAIAQERPLLICSLKPGDKLDALRVALDQPGRAAALSQEWCESAELGEAALGQALHRLANRHLPR